MKLPCRAPFPSPRLFSSILVTLVPMALLACQTMPKQQGSLNPPAQGALIRVSGEVVGASGATNNYSGRGTTLRYASADGVLALSAPVSHLRLGNVASAHSAPGSGETPTTAAGASASTRDRTDADITVSKPTRCTYLMSSKVQVVLENDGTARVKQKLTLGPPTLLAQTNDATFDFRLKRGDPTKIEVLEGGVVVGQFPNGGTYDARDTGNCNLYGSDMVKFRIETAANVRGGGQGGLAIIAADSLYHLKP